MKKVDGFAQSELKKINSWHHVLKEQIKEMRAKIKIRRRPSSGSAAHDSASPSRSVKLHCGSLPTTVSAQNNCLREYIDGVGRGRGWGAKQAIIHHHIDMVPHNTTLSIAL